MWKNIADLGRWFYRGLGLKLLWTRKQGQGHFNNHRVWYEVSSKHRINNQATNQPNQKTPNKQYWGWNSLLIRFWFQLAILFNMVQ